MNRKRIHLAVAVGSVALCVPAFLWWRDSVLFVIALSLFAITYAAISALEAADDSAVIARLDSIEEKLDVLLSTLRSGEPTPPALLESEQ